MKSWLALLAVSAFLAGNPAIALGQYSNYWQQQMQRQQMVQRQQQQIWKQPQMQRQQTLPYYPSVPKQTTVQSKSTGAASSNYGFPRPEGYAWLESGRPYYWVMTSNGPTKYSPSNYDPDWNYKTNGPVNPGPNGGLWQPDTTIGRLP